MEAPKIIGISNGNVRTVISGTSERVIHMIDVIIKGLNPEDTINRTTLLYGGENRPHKITNNEVVEHVISTLTGQVYDLTRVLENAEQKIIDSSTKSQGTQLFDFLEHNGYLQQGMGRFNYVPKNGLARLSVMPSYQIWNELSTKMGYRGVTYGDKKHDFFLSLLGKSKDIPIYSCSEIIGRPKKVDDIVKEAQKRLKVSGNKELIKLLRDFQKRGIISDLDVRSGFFVPYIFFILEKNIPN